MLDPFKLVFVQRGVLEIAALALAAGLIGTWIVTRGLAFYAHAVGTATFPGLVLADGLGFSAHLGAAAVALVVAGSVGWLSRRDHERYDSLTALVLVAALAAGVLLASDVFRSGANVETLLFGSLLVIGPSDVWFALVSSAIVVAASYALETRWMATGFDATAARTLGARSPLPDALLLGLIALVAIASLSALGALLATALLVVPAASTRLLLERLRPWQVATVALVFLEGVAGLWLSVKTNAPPGATIAVLSGGVFVLFALVRVARSRGPLRPALALAGVVGLGIAGCGGSDGGSTGTAAGGGPSTVKVVATTTQLGDLTRNVGGDAVKLTQILKPNTDPHDYEPRPQDVQETAGAKIVFESGDNLDKWMGKVVSQSGGSPTVVDVGATVPVRRPGEPTGPEASKYDPHWWHDPVNAQAAVTAIRDALVKANPSARAIYERNAQAYLAKLKTLRTGIEGCFAKVPPDQRKLVTDHDAFGYFAGRFGVQVIGAVIPSQTTQAQPSAGDVAKLSEVIRREQVKAVFPESSINPKLAQALARQTGISADYTLYGDTLGPSGSTGATYLQMEQANADQMLRGFTGGKDRCVISGL